VVQISKRKLSRKQEEEIKDKLAQLIADLPSKEKAQLFLQDFLTETEYTSLAKRLAIIYYLASDKSYEEIKRDVKVSSATIASMQNLLENKSSGIYVALKFLKADEWAQKWSQKLSGFFGSEK
jgi:uncharacterized protein YerC